MYGGTTIEVKARKSGEGFTQLDKWKGSADLLILKRDFQKPMVYLSWDFFKEFLNDERQNRRRNESGEQADISDQLAGETTIEKDSKESTSKIFTRARSFGQGVRQANRKSWSKGKRKIVSRVFGESKINGKSQLQTRWEYLKKLSKEK